MAENVPSGMSPVAGRRDFLKLALLGVAGGALAATTGRSEADATESTGQPKVGYRETAHIRTYYDLARF